MSHNILCVIYITILTLEIHGILLYEFSIMYLTPTFRHLSLGYGIPSLVRSILAFFFKNNYSVISKFSKTGNKLVNSKKPRK